MNKYCTYCFEFYINKLFFPQKNKIITDNEICDNCNQIFNPKYKNTIYYKILLLVWYDYFCDIIYNYEILCMSCVYNEYNKYNEFINKNRKKNLEIKLEIIKGSTTKIICKSCNKDIGQDYHTLKNQSIYTIIKNNLPIFDLPVTLQQDICKIFKIIKEAQLCYKLKKNKYYKFVSNNKIL